MIDSTTPSRRVRTGISHLGLLLALSFFCLARSPSQAQISANFSNSAGIDMGWNHVAAPPVYHKTFTSSDAHSIFSDSHLALLSTANGWLVDEKGIDGQPASLKGACSLVMDENITPTALDVSGALSVSCISAVDSFFYTDYAWAQNYTYVFVTRPASYTCSCIASGAGTVFESIGMVRLEEHTADGNYLIRTLVYMGAGTNIRTEPIGLPGSVSGILTPGIYLFLTDAHCGEDHGQGVGDHSGSASVNFTFHTETLPDPLATTQSPTGITRKECVLNGSYPMDYGGFVTANFEYGPAGTAGYPNTAPGPINPGLQGGEIHVSTNLSQLETGRTYHYRLRLNYYGTIVYGQDIQFTTLLPPPPTVVTQPATDVLQTAATFHGAINPNGASTTAKFEYGLTAAGDYTDSVAVTLANNSATTDQILTAALVNLKPGSEYHYRLTAETAYTTTSGDEAKFTTTKVPLVFIPGIAGTPTLAAADTSQANPFHFWLNDDHDDYGETGGEDLNDSVVDNADNEITIPRDLEDFALLNLKLTADQVTQLQRGAKVVFSVTGTGSIHLVPISRPGYDYLTDPTYAQTLITKPIDDKPAVPMFLASASANAEFPLDQLFDDPQSGDRTLGFLFEGVTEGDVTLNAEIVNSDGSSIAVSEPFYLKLSEIKKMYDHWTVGDKSEKDFPLYSPPHELNRIDPSTYGPNDPYILFVHGWRLEPWERERFAETAFKRLWWAGYRGPFGLFSWPTEFTDFPLFHPENYDRSEHQAWQSAAGLNFVLDELETGSQPRVNVLAHSMGNIVVSEALRQRMLHSGKQIHSYIASQAASVASAYNPNVPILQLGPLYGTSIGEISLFDYPEADVYRRGQPNDGKGLYFGIGSMTSSGIVNFCNPTDWALKWWKKGQDFKPNKGYGFNRVTKQFTLEDLSFILQEDTELYQALSFAVPGTSLPLGAEPTKGGEISQVQLLNQPPLWYGGDSNEHSAEFLSDIQHQLPYWQLVLGYFGIKLAPDFPSPSPIVGIYNGTILPTFPEDPTHAGMFKLILGQTLTAFSVTFTMGGESYSFHSALQSAGHWEGTITPRKGVSFFVSVDVNGDHLVGSITSDGVVSEIVGGHTASYTAKRPAPNIGHYTVFLNPTEAADTIPQGTGYATVTVNKLGHVKIVGKLADGTPFNAVGSLVNGATGNQFFISQQLKYAGKKKMAKGLLAGHLTFEDMEGSNLDGVLEWIRPQKSKGIYSNGFDTSLNVVGSRYTAPIVSGGTVLPGFNTGTLELSDTTALSLSAEAQLDKAVSLALPATLKVSDPSSDLLRIKVTKSNGRFRGSFVYPGSSKPVSISGVLLQSGMSGAGFFLGPNGSGNVTLTPLP